MTDLSGKVAVVTGGASGIGLATVELFIEAGARVIVGDIQEEKGRALEARFGSDSLRFSRCDVTSTEDLRATINLSQEAFGGLDILFNNAGIGGSACSIEELDLDGYDSTMDILLKSVFVATHLAVPLMKERGGAIINTSSISAITAGYAPIIYSVAKKGVAHFSKVAAAELAKYKIRVNAVLPGFIATPIFGASLGFSREQADQMAAMLAETGHGIQPMGRPGEAADIGSMVAFLASDAASFITGSEFVVDGGIMVGPPHAWNEKIAPPIMDALGIDADAL